MHATASRAMDIVFEFEELNFRSPKRQPNSSGVDIKSLHRYIEVKGMDKTKNGFILLSNFNLKCLYKYQNYYLYVVVFSGKKYDLYTLRKNAILKMINPDALKIIEIASRKSITQLTLNYSLRLNAIIKHGKNVFKGTGKT